MPSQHFNKLTYIGSVCESRVSSVAGLDNVGGDAEGPQGTHQLLVDLCTTGAAHPSTHVGKVGQSLTVKEGGRKGGR